MATRTGEAGEPKLDEILQEITDEEVSQTIRQTETNAHRTVKKAQVSKENVLQVLQDIENDNAIGAKFKTIAKECQNNVEDLCKALAFLPECIDNKPKFPSAAKESSWGRFHSAVINKSSQLHEITKSPPFSSWLCLKLFPCLLNETFKKSVTCSKPTEYQVQEDDIVIYIGGSVVAKLRKAAYRLTDEERTAQFDILSHLIDLTAETSSDSLTDILDRGGLTRLMPQIQAMFIEMECVFLEMFSGSENTKLSVDQYRTECLQRDAILCGYYETTYVSVTHETVKHQVLMSILALYFRIRAYHKCRSYMDKYRQKKQLALRQKALRESIKQK